MNDYAEWARKFARPDFSCDVDWEGAKAEFERLRLMHLVPGCSQHVVGMNLGCPPDHDPVTEHILSVKMESDQKAVVETDREGNYPMSFEYSLQLVGTEWRIGKVREFFGAEGEKVTDADLELLKMWPTEAVPFAAVPDGLARFDGPARLQTSGGIAKKKKKNKRKEI